MLRLGHRGAKLYAAENSIAAFDLALEHGCDGFEFDVHLSSDGVPVVVHDARVRRVSISLSTLGSLKSTLKLPTLEEVLERFHRNAFLDIELKVIGAEEALADLLRRYHCSRGLVVSSFLPEALSGLHRVAPDIPLGFICDAPGKLHLWRTLPLKYIIVQRRLATELLVQEAAAVGCGVMVWTVNNERDMRRYADMGVSGIISDDTQLLCRVLRSQVRS